MEHFVFKKNCVPKIWFPIVFSKSDLDRGGGTYSVKKKKILKKSNTPEYAQVLVVTCPKLNFVAALYPPSPLIKVQILYKKKRKGKNPIKEETCIDYISHKPGSLSIRQLPDFNMAAAWSIRPPPGFTLVAAWLIRHLPDFNLVVAWSITQCLIFRYSYFLLLNLF